jgi:hypothetical protein
MSLSLNLKNFIFKNIKTISIISSLNSQDLLLSFNNRDRLSNCKEITKSILYILVLFSRTTLLEVVRTQVFFLLEAKIIMLR